MQAVVLAAGKGKRMRGLCDNFAKPMLPLANTPLLAHILEGLAPAGIRKAHVVIGHCAEQIRSYFADRTRAPIELNFIGQPQPTGTGSAVLLAGDFLKDESFLLAFGDIVVAQRTYRLIVEHLRATACDAVLSVRRVEDPCEGAAVFVEDGFVKRIVEKPPAGTSASRFNNAGIFVLPAEVFTFLAKAPLSPRGEYELTDALQAMLDAGMRVAAYDIEGFWFNLTEPEALLAANAAVLGERCPKLSDAPGAQVREPVAIGRDCRIGKCELGPEASIGDGCALEDGCVVSRSILMTGARVGNGARVRYAVVGPRAEVPAFADRSGKPCAPRQASRGGRAGAVVILP